MSSASGLGLLASAKSRGLFLLNLHPPFLGFCDYGVRPCPFVFWQDVLSPFYDAPARGRYRCTPNTSHRDWYRHLESRSYRYLPHRASLRTTLKLSIWWRSYGSALCGLRIRSRRRCSGHVLFPSVFLKEP